VASLQARALNGLRRATALWLFGRPRPLRRYAEMFARADARAARPLPSGYSLREVDDPIPGRWIRPDGGEPRLTLLHLHGGAFFMRMPNAHTHLVASLCAPLHAQGFLPWYRLTPAHPFPAAPQDALAAYRHLLEQGVSPDRIVVSGDSAGGNLALSLLHLAKREGLAMPGGAVLFSPITDFVQVSGSWRLNRWRDPMYRAQGAVAPQRHYLNGVDPRDPIASPYYGDISGFPPLLFVVGALEALLEDSVGFVRKAVEARVPARVSIWSGVGHVFLLQDLLPETTIAKSDVVDWIRRTVDERRPAVEDAYRRCVEVVDRHPLTGRITRRFNDVDWPAP